MSKLNSSNEVNNKYIVYKNDLKYRKNRDLDISRVEWFDKDDEKLFKENLDTLEYRLKECVKEGNTTLDLVGLELTKFPEIPEEIAKSVKDLFLGENNLTKLSSIALFKQLESIDLNTNKLKTIDSLSESLIELSCPNNQLEKLPSSAYLPNLQKLDCRNNMLTYISEYPKVTIIDCSNNELSSIGDMPCIKRLICTNNKITSIGKCNELIYLDCRHTSLTNILNYSKLKDLNIAHTNLKTIPILQNVRSIDCRYTDVTIIPYLENLQELVCEHKKTKGIDKRYKAKTKTARIIKNLFMHITFNQNNITDIKNDH